ncbi:hypothetical protein AGMMS49543_13200 [Betaproteobacteria bacterium]|nr:hypothetical protein AGMMS49543_13200 [Betaproteobacteria bacterium]
MRPDEPGWHLSHETIYRALYALPRGQLRRELIAQLRFAHKRRKSRSGGKDRRGSLPNMTSIHLRPVEVAARQVPGHWEGDLIKGVGNRSSRKATSMPLPINSIIDHADASTTKLRSRSILVKSVTCNTVLHFRIETAPVSPPS